ncbi:MAG: ribonuclease III [Clostridia bacterium]
MSAKETEKLNIGYSFKDTALLKSALTHSSYVKSTAPSETHNERLEFLGDAVLELVISEFLYKNFNLQEGEMTRRRAHMVNEAALFRAAKSLSLGEFIRMSSGEENTSGREKPSILSDALEAVIGAVFLDGGFSAACSFILERVVCTEETDERDYKTQLQEAVQGARIGEVHYKLIEATGPDHKKLFNMAVLINEKEYGRGIGKSKQEAGQKAAQIALSALFNEHCEVRGGAL